MSDELEQRKRGAERSLEHGKKFPYDATDAWWASNKSPPLADDWAHTAARGILVDLQDRGGIKHSFADIDEDVRADIVTALADIIRAAAPEKSA